MEKKYKFRALTANKYIEIKPVTLKALEFAIDEKSEVTNVAITGNYGAGKSSIVESFEEKYKNKKFIHISLGQYDETISSEKNGLNNRQINTIEGKIINQLLHQINTNKIRKSIFKTLDTESLIKPLNITIYLGLIILFSLYLFYISSWKELIQNFSYLSWLVKPILSIIAFILLFALVLYGLFYLIKLQKDFGFIKKLSLKAEKIETDIEVFSNDNTKVSYFDRYLDDVLYLFKQSGADVIVFEDIERFNDSRIFEKLKELNTVINRKRKICEDSKLVFFYLVKDDLFESQERTKFFDYIIPVVPVVTASNSHEILKELLTDMGEYSSFDKTFLFNISLYLDDMRLINNVCNEYLTYKETLNTIQLEQEKLFSIVVYKNIFPKDFSLLQRNQGFLYELLNSKDNKLEERKDRLKRKIELLEINIAKAKEEQLNDEIELYGTILKIPNGIEVIKVNGKSQSQFTSYSEFIKELLKQGSKINVFDSFYSAYNNNSTGEVNLDSIFPEKNTPEFQERLDNTKNKKLIKKFEEDVKKVNEELEALDSKRLSDIYQSALDIDEFKSDFIEDLKKNPQFAIISFLIRNSYIDENYQDYLTYFYENTITVGEKEYLRNVISGRHNSYDIPIKNYDALFNYLQMRNFNSSNVLNYDLFRYLLNSNKRSEKLKLIFHQENILDFLMKFYDELPRLDWDKELISKENVTKLFFQNWLQYNSSLFVKFIKHDSEEFGHIYKSKLILSLMNIVDLSNCDTEVRDSVASYIESNQEVLFHTNDYHFVQFNENLSHLNIKIKEFTFLSQGYEKSILNYIYKYGLYDICEPNVLFFMEQYSDIDTQESDVKHKNYEILNNNIELKPLLDYCQSSDEEFLKYTLMYVTLSGGEMRDKPEYIEQLLNNDVVFNYQVPQEQLESEQSDEVGNDESIKKVTLAEEIISSIPDFYITYTQTKFNALSNENREILVQNLVHTQKAEVNTEIILDYFSQYNKGDNFLVDFINQNTNFEFDKEIYLKLDKELQEKFAHFVLEQSNINKKVRIRLLKKIGYPYYEKIDDIDIDDEQMEFLIGYELIEFNKENLDFIRQNYPDNLAYFISMNKFDYLITAKDIRDAKLMKEWREDSDLAEIYKVEILVFLLDNRFNDEYFEYLLTNNIYENVEIEAQTKIQNIVKKYIRQFIDSEDKEISYSLYDSILNSDDVFLEHKKELLEKLISDSESQIEVDKLILLGNYLDLLELPDIMQILFEQIDDDIYTEWGNAFKRLNQNEGNGGKGNQEAKISYSEFNEKLLDYLKKRKFISKKSRRENSVLRLFGLRSKQIEFEDSSGENNE